MLQIKSIPAFDDNYIWLIQNRDRDCAVVDPGSAEPVLAYLKQNDLNLKAVLITHHHHDHIGGVAELVHQFPRNPCGRSSTRAHPYSHSSGGRWRSNRTV